MNNLIDFLLTNGLEILGTIVGIAYLYWEYRASMKVWLAGIVMPALSLYVYWTTGLYADFAINIYYLVAAVYGWWVWRTGHAEGADFRPIVSTPRSAWLPLIGASLVIWGALTWLLVTFTPSTVPVGDAFTTALSIVGMVMLARKWVEQWFVWVAVDTVSAYLYVVKGIYFYAALYAVYAVVAFFGYFEWKRKMRETECSPTAI